MNVKKRTLALILTWIMLCSMAVTAIAEGVGEESTAGQEGEAVVTESVTAEEETAADTEAELLAHHNFV